MYALVDCNSFYCSCERLFRPDLEGRPVIVLSNNDGCVISRNTEAKALGVPMGAPWFQVRELAGRKNIAVFSSNYELYGDLSRRVMSVLSGFTPEIEIYSIDEAFLDLAGFQDPWSLAKSIQNRVQQWTGIPVSAGIGPTRTLAKAASFLAKRNPGTGGVLVLENREEISRALRQMKAGNIWGVGRRWAAHLQALGIHTAEDLCRADSAWIGRRFGAVLERTCRELAGVPCLSQERQPSPRHQIIVSRSFGKRVTDPAALREALVTHTARAAEKLRQEGLAAQVLQVFTQTGDPSQHRATAVSLPYPTQDTRLLAQAAVTGLNRLYHPEYRYRKAGVIMLELRTPGPVQGDLLEGDTSRADRERAERLMAAMDRINHTLGKGSVTLASQGTLRSAQDWKMRRDRCSPHFTTRWSDLRELR